MEQSKGMALAQEMADAINAKYEGKKNLRGEEMGEHARVKYCGDKVCEVVVESKCGHIGCLRLIVEAAEIFSDKYNTLVATMAEIDEKTHNPIVSVMFTF